LANGHIHVSAPIPPVNMAFGQMRRSVSIVPGALPQATVRLAFGQQAFCRREVVSRSLHGYGADGSTMTDRWTIKSPTLEESDGTGVSPQGTPATRKLRIEKKPDEFTWTASGRTDGGKALPDLIIVFRRVEK
jgi:hypothetical protein